MGVKPEECATRGPRRIARPGDLRVNFSWGGCRPAPRRGILRRRAALPAGSRPAALARPRAMRVRAWPRDTRDPAHVRRIPL